VEHAALAAVEGQHVLIERDAGKRLVDDAARDAGGLRLARHGGDEGLEVAAAARGAGRRGKQEGDKESGEETEEHRRSSLSPLPSGEVERL